MEAAKEGEFELFSLLISCSIPTLESISRIQKTNRVVAILGKNPNCFVNEMSTLILKTLLSKSKNKDKFQKKGHLIVFNAFE